VADHIQERDLGPLPVADIWLAVHREETLASAVLSAAGAPHGQEAAICPCRPAADRLWAVVVHRGTEAESGHDTKVVAYLWVAATCLYNEVADHHDQAAARPCQVETVGTCHGRLAAGCSVADSCSPLMMVDPCGSHDAAAAAVVDHPDNWVGEGCASRSAAAVATRSGSDAVDDRHAVVAVCYILHLCRLVRRHGGDRPGMNRLGTSRHHRRRLFRPALREVYHALREVCHSLLGWDQARRSDLGGWKDAWAVLRGHAP
jgi:hypothetical protein